MAELVLGHGADDGWSGAARMFACRPAPADPRGGLEFGVAREAGGRCRIGGVFTGGTDAEFAAAAAELAAAQRTRRGTQFDPAVVLITLARFTVDRDDFTTAAVPGRVAALVRAGVMDPDADVPARLRSHRGDSAVGNVRLLTAFADLEVIRRVAARALTETNEFGIARALLASGARVDHDSGSSEPGVQCATALEVAVHEAHRRAAGAGAWPLMFEFTGARGADTPVFGREARRLSSLYPDDRAFVPLRAPALFAAVLAATRAHRVPDDLAFVCGEFMGVKRRRRVVV